MNNNNLHPQSNDSLSGLIIAVMNDEEDHLNPSNQIESYLKIVQTQTQSAPVVVANNYTLFAQQ